MSSAASSQSSLHVPGGGDGLNFGFGKGAGSVYPSWYRDQDPRSSSTQSLAPSDPGIGDGARRKLLIVYIHGFMGNDSSFRSFPAHVHIYLKDALAESHVIHTKVYPRYKTYKAIEVARDNFSRWLEPHESPTTDVVLVGHSMGGLLAAEIVLIVSLAPQTTLEQEHQI
jgi:pimeloyl-ACP methyl ester carboxylesterase